MAHPQFRLRQGSSSVLIAEAAPLALAAQVIKALNFHYTTILSDNQSWMDLSWTILRIGGSNHTLSWEQFFNFNLFLIILKNNPWQTLYAPGDPFGRAWLPAAPHAPARQRCHAGQPRRAPGVGSGLPCHMRRRDSFAAPPRLARQPRVIRARTPFLPPHPFLPLPELTCIRRHRRQPAHPKSGDFWWG
jgi:hypothetical protein